MRVPGWTWAAVAAVVVAGCATAPPPAPPVSDPAALRARYAVALAGRTALAHALEADVRLWARVDGRRLPGAAGRVLIAAPDAVRLRLDGVLGAALDGSLRDDSLTLHLAARRQGVQVAAFGESLGITAPGALLVRTLAASWPVEGLAPDAETRGPAAADVTVDARGRVRRVTWRAADGRAFALEYLRWTYVRDVAWPVQWRLAVDEDAIEVECRLDRLRPLESLDPGRMRVTLPRGIERVAAAALAAGLRKAP